jgi:hypothetical protein
MLRYAKARNAGLGVVGAVLVNDQLARQALRLPALKVQPHRFFERNRLGRADRRRP